MACLIERQPSRTSGTGPSTLKSLRPLHGYAIAGGLEQASSGGLQLNMATLYPALMRREPRGPLCGNWGMTNRDATFHAGTSAGQRQLAREKDAWHRMAGINHTLLHGEA